MNSFGDAPLIVIRRVVANPIWIASGSDSPSPQESAPCGRSNSCPPPQNKRTGLRCELLEDRTTPAVQTFTVANLNDTGAGSLRAAITSANGVAAPDTPTIQFQSGLTGTIDLQTELPHLSHTGFVINGNAGIVVERAVGAATKFRVFTADGGKDATIHLLSIKNGSLAAGDGKGGGVAALGAASRLTIDQCDVFNNFAADGGGGVAYDSNAHLYITGSSTIRNNNTWGDGGGVYAYAFDETGVDYSKIDNSSVTNNTATGNGGGVFVATGSATAETFHFSLNYSSIGTNRADGKGGGVYIAWDNVLHYVPVITVSGGSISNNLSKGAGGALYSLGGQVTCTGTQFSTNTGGTDGYVIYDGTVFLGALAFGSMKLDGCQVTSNLFVDPNGQLNKADQAAIWTQNGAAVTTLTMKGTTVTGNDGHGVRGHVKSEGNNVVANSATTSSGWIPPPQPSFDQVS